MYELGGKNTSFTKIKSNGENVGIPAISRHQSSPNTCTHARDHLDTEELRDKDVFVLQNWQRFSP
jgi:hypothetical protein